MTSGRAPFGSVLEVPGIRVGNHERIGGGFFTGTTVLVPPPGSVVAADVRGGGPATHETAITAPGTLPYGADAVVLTGGSAFGLAAVHGVMAGLEQRGLGFPAPSEEAGDNVVPIVPAAAIFDAGRGGDFAARPDASFGAAALEAALADTGVQGFSRGVAGAGTGANAHSSRLQGGLGTASIRLPSGHVVAALVVANPGGGVADANGRLYAAAFDDRIPGPTAAETRAWRDWFASAGTTAPPRNTTIAVVATDAALDSAQTLRLAASAQAGLARAVRPSHTLFDGDTIFGLTTRNRPIAPGHTGDLSAGLARPAVEALAQLHAAAADALTLAIADAVLSDSRPAHGGTSAARPPRYGDLCPSVGRALGYS